MHFRLFLEEITSFTTAKGSTYEFDNGRSRRFKVHHQFHPPKDIGWQEISDKTIFINPSLSQEVGMWASMNAKKRLVLSNQRIFLISWNDGRNDWGLDAIHTKDTSYEDNPKVGLAPLELWNMDTKSYSSIKPGTEMYRGFHPGTPIISVSETPGRSVTAGLSR